jgi:hypothetical protein
MPATTAIDQFKPLFDATFPSEPEAFEEIAAEVRAGRAFVMVSPSGKSLIVLQPMRELHCWGALGDMQEIVTLEGEITEKARASGFDRMSILPSRKGWDRVLRDRGWKPETRTPLVKDL